MTRIYPTVADAKRDALRALDVLLGSGYPGHPDKAAAFREIAETATRMAKGIEQSARDRQRHDERLTVLGA